MILTSHGNSFKIETYKVYDLVAATALINKSTEKIWKLINLVAAKALGSARRATTEPRTLPKTRTLLYIIVFCLKK